ncbi:MAG: DegT/DnrJ/EryC1/StrS family aminotransferase [Thermomicrobiales bacterium]
MRTIPVAEPMLGEAEVEAVVECIRSGWISSKGAYVEAFERAFPAFCQASYGVSTSNGTTALHLALLALDVGPGDEVIVPTLTFVATANAARYVGASVVFADCDPATWCIDPRAIEAAITERTKAIIPVHLYGHPCDMDAIGAIAGRHGIAVIEDAAEAHGAEIRGRRVGSFGTMACFSFYGNKVFTTGEGGMVVTDDAALAAKMRQLRDHGMDPTRKYWHPVIGYNYRLTNIQAAIGMAQLARADEIIHRKRAIARAYAELLADVPGIALAPEEPWARSVYWMCSILLEDERRHDRDAVMARLAEQGIETRPFFYPIHTMPAYNTGETLPIAESLARRGINLPSSPTLSDDDLERVAAAVREALGAGVAPRQGPVSAQRDAVLVLSR